MQKKAISLKFYLIVLFLNNIDELIEAGERKLINCSVFFDLAKAFNTANHKISISKL